MLLSHSRAGAFPRRASELKVGDMVFCGTRPTMPAPLVKVMNCKKRTALVELTFATDDPVET